MLASVSAKRWSYVISLMEVLKAVELSNTSMQDNAHISLKGALCCSSVTPVATFVQTSYNKLLKERHRGEILYFSSFDLDFIVVYYQYFVIVVLMLSAVYEH